LIQKFKKKNIFISQESLSPQPLWDHSIEIFKKTFFKKNQSRDIQEIPLHNPKSWMFKIIKNLMMGWICIILSLVAFTRIFETEFFKENHINDKKTHDIASDTENIQNNHQKSDIQSSQKFNSTHEFQKDKNISQDTSVVLKKSDEYEITTKNILSREMESCEKIIEFQNAYQNDIFPPIHEKIQPAHVQEQFSIETSDDKNELSLLTKSKEIQELESENLSTQTTSIVKKIEIIGHCKTHEEKNSLWFRTVWIGEHLYHKNALLFFLMILFFICPLFLILLIFGRFISLYRIKLLRTQYFWLHAIRGSGFFLGILAWCMGLSSVSLPLATIIGFFTPLSTLILSFLFRFEVLSFRTCMATLIGFSGIIVAVKESLTGINGGVLWLVGACFIFAALDLLNKSLVDDTCSHIDQEEKSSDGLIAMLFYSSLWTLGSSLIYGYFTLPHALSVDNLWQVPTVQDIVGSFILGCGSNLILFFWLKAMKNSPSLSFLQPFKYLEFLTSLLLGWLFFKEMPTRNAFISAILIIPSGFFIVKTQDKKEVSNI
jgi:S-adenosylmethionine uptake transporter